MITQGLMTLDSWELKLKPYAPTTIRRSFTWGAQVFFLAAHLGDESVSYSTLKSAAAFMGPVFRRSESLTRFGGPGVLGYLQSGKGHAGNHTNTPAFPATFTQIITDWLDGTGAKSNGLSVGTGYSPTATTIDQADNYSYAPPVKPKLDEWAKQTGNEYKANPDGTVDYGVATSLFVSTPTVVVAPGLRGREGSYTLLNVTKWSPSEDVDDLRNSGNVAREDLTGAVTAGGGGSFSFKHFTFAGGIVFGNEYEYLPSSADADDLTDLATAIAAEYQNPHRDYSGCSVREYCLPRLLTPGDYVYVYDLDSDIYDTANQITVGGEVLFPRKVRCMGYSWPMEAGMGVYTYYDGTLTDVTDWVEWETDAETTLQLESLPRRVVDPINRSRVAA